MHTLYPVNHLIKTTPESTLGLHFISFKSQHQLLRNLKFCQLHFIWAPLYMDLNNNNPFNTWRAQLLVQIEKILNPCKLNINDYEIHFTIACVSPSLLMVSSDEEYTNMLEHVGRSKDSACNVYVQELHSPSKVGITPCLSALSHFYASWTETRQREPAWGFRGRWRIRGGGGT